MSAKSTALKLRKDAAELHLVNTIDTLHDHVRIDHNKLSKHYNVKASQMQNIHTTEQFLLVRPTSSINSNAYSSGSQTNFRFYRDIHLMLKNTALKLTLTNTSGGAIRLPPSPFLIKYFEIYGNSSQQISRVTGLQIYEDLIMYASPDEREAFKNIFNIDPVTYASLGTIAAGATVDYYIPLPSFFSQGAVWAGAFKKELEWRIYLDPDSIETGLATDVSITDMEIRVDCEKLDDNQVYKQQELYKTKMDFRYLWYQDQSFNFTVNANSQYMLDMQALVGISPYLTWSLRASTAGAGLYTFADINGTSGRGGTQELLNQNNSTEMNGFEEEISYTRGVLAPKYYQPGWINQRFINTLTFSMQPEAAIKAAQNLGYQCLYENKLRFRTGTGWTNGSYNITVNNRQFSVICFEPDGNISIQRS